MKLPRVKWNDAPGIDISDAIAGPLSPRMRRIAIVNQKGGTGKTTTAVNLAAALGERGRKVLVIDLDPQASASLWLGVRDESRGLLDVLKGQGSLAALVVALPKVRGVSLVPGSSWLMAAEVEVSDRTALKMALGRLAEWDFVLLDCPPSLGILTANALAAAGEVLAPVEASALAMQGLERLLESVRIAREKLNPTLALAGILACSVDLRTRHSQEVVERLRKLYGSEVFRTIIRKNVALAEAYSFGPITSYEPSSHGAEDYRRLAAELVKKERRA